MAGPGYRFHPVLVSAAILPAMSVGGRNVAARAVAWVAVAVWAVVILGFSGESFSHDSTSRFLKPLLRWLFPAISEEQLGAAHFVVRKGAHVAEYGVLALLAWRAWRLSLATTLGRRSVLALSLVLGVAAADEGRQSRLSQRQGSAADVVLDLSGGALALAGVALWGRIRPRRDTANTSPLDTVGDDHG